MFAFTPLGCFFPLIFLVFFSSSACSFRNVRCSHVARGAKALLDPLCRCQFSSKINQGLEELWASILGLPFLGITLLTYLRAVGGGSKQAYICGHQSSDSVSSTGSLRNLRHRYQPGRTAALLALKIRKGLLCGLGMCADRLGPDLLRRTAPVTKNLETSRRTCGGNKI